MASRLVRRLGTAEAPAGGSAFGHRALLASRSLVVVMGGPMESFAALLDDERPQLEAFIEEYRGALEVQSTV